MAPSRRRRSHAAGHDNDERWLLTYSDMITLLMALFMVLFSISSVNISKYRTLQQSLKAAFSGSVLPGGKAILQSGSQSTQAHSPATSAIPAIVPLTPNTPTLGRTDSALVSQAQAQVNKSHLSIAQVSQAQSIAAAAKQEQQDFQQLQEKLNQYIDTHGLRNQVQTVISRRGLVVRVLTDRVLFDSGQANLKPEGDPLLGEIANLLNVDRRHPIVVEGHTDNVPIASAQFPSNWELSTARATTVVRFLIGRGVDRSRLSASGYADLHPIATNATDAGRQLNRRVEIVLQRLNPELQGTH
jgi:chemotaxis protein MotB